MHLEKGYTHTHTLELKTTSHVARHNQSSVPDYLGMTPFGGQVPLASLLHMNPTLYLHPLVALY